MRGDGERRLSPSRMASYFDQVETHLGAGPICGRPVAHRRGDAARLRRAGMEARAACPERAGVRGLGFCHLGCRSDARKSTNLSYLPPALERGAQLFTGLKAERVVVENGRAVGLEAVAATGNRVRVRARAVVLAGGTISTPLFLLRQGLANGSGQVGRNLTVHPSAVVMALFDEEIRGFDHIPQGYGSEQFLEEGLLLVAAQASHNAMPSMFPSIGRRLMEPLAQLPRGGRGAARRGRDSQRPGLGRGPGRRCTPADVTRLKRGLELSMQMLVAAGARLYPGVLGMGALEPYRVDGFRKMDLAASALVGRYTPWAHARWAATRGPAWWAWITRRTTSRACSSSTGARCADRSG